jgi:hypothetical protein
MVRPKRIARPQPRRAARKFQEWFRAKVVWTREVDDHQETGFQIILQ